MLSTALSPCRGVNSRSRDGSSLLGPIGQPVKVEPVVFLGVKAYGAVIATLNEVPGDRDVGVVRVLLDTHTLLWALMEPEKLSEQARALIENPVNTLLVSSASACGRSLRNTAWEG
jgi:hypothetical protein